MAAFRSVALATSLLMLALASNSSAQTTDKPDNAGKQETTDKSNRESPNKDRTDVERYNKDVSRNTEKALDANDRENRGEAPSPTPAEKPKREE